MAKNNLPLDKNQIVGQTGMNLGIENMSGQKASVGEEIVKKTFESFVKTK